MSDRFLSQNFIANGNMPFTSLVDMLQIPRTHELERCDKIHSYFATLNFTTDFRIILKT